MTAHAADHELSHGQREIRIARDGLPIPRRCLVERLRRLRGESGPMFVLTLQEKIICRCVLCRRNGKGVSFGRGKLRAQRIDDLLRDFALDRGPANHGRSF